MLLSHIKDQVTHNEFALARLRGSFSFRLFDILGSLALFFLCGRGSNFRGLSFNCSCSSSGLCYFLLFLLFFSGGSSDFYRRFRRLHCLSLFSFSDGCDLLWVGYFDHVVCLFVVLIILK
jgi:hypothetical protein